MNSAAVIVGIDQYIESPLTSAVNDAKSFRQILLDLALVDESRIKMLTTPLGDSHELAERDNIANTLYDFYARGESCDRFFFFYAGHGLMALADGAQSIARTTLVSSDVQVFERDGAKLLNFEEILDKFRQSGPSEQFYFIDACRDLNYTRHPDVGKLGWGGGQLLGAARKQAVLYAVSELGQALSVKGGMGQMTSYLVKALRSKSN